ncbi:hypothetical protein WCLP8_3240002 [uncultured Gammaproteobacteria bacterium]
MGRKSVQAALVAVALVAAKEAYNALCQLLVSGEIKDGFEHIVLEIRQIVQHRFIGQQ